MNHSVKVRENGKEYSTFEDILPVDSTIDLLIVGKVPAPESVASGHYFQGKHGKAMWNKLTEYGILKQMTPYHDDSLLANRIGITDIVKEPREFPIQPTLSEYIDGKERILGIIEKYSPKVIFFVYKPVVEVLVPFMSKVEYGFNDHLSRYFNGCKVFLFPMPGTGNVTRPIIEAAMRSLKKELGK